MKKDSFILYTEQKAIIDKLTDEQAGKLIKAIYEYVATNKMPELDSILDLVIIPFTTALDRNKEKYEETCKRRALAGAKGGKQKVANVANASKCKQNVANVADNDNEHDNDSDSDNDNEYDTAIAVIKSDGCADGSQQFDSCVDGIVKFYNENIGMITPYVFEILNSYRTDFSDDVIIYALKLQVEAKASNINYAKAILNSWKKKNIKTLLDAKRENEEKKLEVKKDEKIKNIYQAENEQYQDLSKFYSN